MPTIEDVISGLCLAQTEKLKGVDEEVRKRVLCAVTCIRVDVSVIEGEGG